MFDPASSLGRWQLFEFENFFRGSLLTMGIVKNDPDLVKQGLEQGESPNERYSYEEDNDSITIPNPVHTITPIVQAAVIESLPIAKLLIEYGADVNLCQRNGESALINAANRGNVELASFLLEHGADPNLGMQLGTPLTLADGAAVMKVLLSYGADPNVPDEDGDLPIVGAIDTNNLEEIELLINCGTDMRHANKRGETPLERAKRRGNYNEVMTFIQAAEQAKSDVHPVPLHKSASGTTIPELSAACEAGDFRKALALLKSGADPNKKAADGRTPLHCCKEVALVCLLEHFGADVNATDASGNTPLALFLAGDNENRNCERAIIFLIEAGADVEIRNKKGVSAREISQITPNYDLRAAFRQGLDIVENQRGTYEGMLARQQRGRKEWYAECEPLAPAGDWEHAITTCFTACVLSDLDVLKANEEFVQDNLTVTIGSEHENWRSMLMVACSDASAEVVRYLISLGADVNQVDNTGQAALRYAAISWRDASEKITALVNAGADVNHRSNDGSAALSDAAYEQNVAAARALISHGADINNRDAQGYTAISWACGKGTPEADIVELLLRAGADVHDLYEMGCILQYVDYESGGYGRPRELFLRPQDLRERHLYEHSLIPARLSEHGRQQLRSQGFDF